MKKVQFGKKIDKKFVGNKIKLTFASLLIRNKGV